MKDLIILGNGMAGMTAALYAKRANLDFKIVGRDEYDFGQIANAVCVENFPCAKPQPGQDLAMNLHDQLTIKNDIIIEEHEVTKLTRAMINHYGLGFHIDYADGTDDFCKTVIYALGASHRKLNCEIEEGIPIHYCAVCDGAFYKNKTVAIIGGGDVAFTEAEYLSKICKLVIIVMCDNNVTAAPSTFERVKNINNIYIEYDFPVAAILKVSHGLFGIYKEKPSSHLYTHYGPHVDGIFVAIGMIPNTAPLKEIATLDKDGNLWCWPGTLQSMTTPGLFGAGDVRFKQVRQAITAAADGATAVQSVINYLKKNS
jgi:thioredoxin reductase (NADPH)